MKKSWPLRRPTNPHHGHTLVEMMVVIALLVLLVSLISVPGDFLNRMLVRAQVEKLQAACRYLQRRAMAEGKQLTLQFDRHTDSYRCDTQHNTLPKQVTFGILPGTKGPPSSPTHPLASPITFEHDRITFGADGIMQSGTVYLTDTSHRCLYALTAGVGTISHLRTYCYRTSWQLLS